MFKRIVLLTLVAASASAQTNTAELEKARLELAVERAKFEAEKARFEAEKAKWEAQRVAWTATGAPASASSVVITNGPADPLYLVQETTRLYRNGQLAGEVPAGSIVKTRPHPRDAKWRIVLWQGGEFEMAAAPLQETSTYLAGLERRAMALRQRTEDTRRELEAARKRRADIDHDLTDLEGRRNQTVVVVPPSNPGPTNRPNQVLVLSNDPSSGSHAARLRRDAQQNERDIAALEKQLADLQAERDRAESALARARAAVEVHAGR